MSNDYTGAGEVNQAVVDVAAAGVEKMSQLLDEMKADLDTVIPDGTPKEDITNASYGNYDGKLDGTIGPDEAAAIAIETSNITAGISTAVGFSAAIRDAVRGAQQKLA